MTFEAILKAARLDNYEILQMADPARHIHGARLITGGETQWLPNVLYVGPLYALPRRLEQGECADFCVSGTEEALTGLEAESYRRTNFILLPADADLSAAFNRLNDPIIQDLAHHDSMRDLTNALFADRGLQYLVDMAFRLMGNPIIVRGLSGAHLAMALGDAPVTEPDSILGKLWRDSEENQTPTPEAMEYDKRTRVHQILSRRNTPYVYHHEILGHRIMCSLAWMHGVEVAQVSMIEYYHPFQPSDNVVFGSLARYVGHELSKNLFYKSNKGQKRSYFLMDLLNDPHMTGKAVDRRLTSIDYALKDTFYLAVFRQRTIRAHDHRNVDMVLVTENLAAPVLSGHLYAVGNDELLVLFNFERERDWKNPTLSQLTQCAAATDCLWGLSNAFHSLSQVQQAYYQARQAVEFGNQYFFLHEICPTRLVVFYKYISSISMLEICNKSQPLHTFIDPELLELKAYDDHHQTEYLLTLHAFLQCGMNRKETSERLHIHKNTTNYRINKLMDLLHTDFTNGEELHRFYLSMRIMLYLNMLDSSRYYI